MRGHKIFAAEIGGHNFIDADFLCKYVDPLLKKMIGPLGVRPGYFRMTNLIEQHTTKDHA